MTPFLEVFVSMSLSTFISIPSLKRYFLFPTTTRARNPSLNLALLWCLTRQHSSRRHVTMGGKQEWVLALASLIVGLDPESIDGSSEGPR